MCGRYSLDSPLDDILSYFDISIAGEILAQTNLQPRYNIAPTQPVLIVRNHPDQKHRELMPVEWGLMAEWMKEKPPKPLINARLETVLQKPSFKANVIHRRCLFPMNGFYEWKTIEGQKQPFFISLKDSPLMAVAGIWSLWHGPDGEHMLETAAMITRGANQDIRPVHHRMPMVVGQNQFDLWLNGGEVRVQNILDQIPPLGLGKVLLTPVSKQVNDIYKDHEGLIQPIELDEKPKQASLFGD